MYYRPEGGIAALIACASTLVVPAELEGDLGKDRPAGPVPQADAGLAAANADLPEVALGRGPAFAMSALPEADFGLAATQADLPEVALGRGAALAAPKAPEADVGVAGAPAAIPSIAFGEDARASLIADAATAEPHALLPHGSPDQGLMSAMTGVADSSFTSEMTGFTSEMTGPETTGPDMSGVAETGAGLIAAPEALPGVAFGEGGGSDLPVSLFADAGLVDPLGLAPLAAPVATLAPAAISAAPRTAPEAAPQGLALTSAPAPLAVVDIAPATPLAHFSLADAPAAHRASVAPVTGPSPGPVVTASAGRSAGLIETRATAPSFGAGEGSRPDAARAQAAHAAMADATEEATRASPARAMPRADAAQQQVIDRLNRLEQQLLAQSAQLAEQAQTIARQQEQIVALRQGASDEAMLASRARGADPLTTPLFAMQAAAAIPARPVGEAPRDPEPAVERVVTAVPEGLGVLTPRGRWVFDPSVEYTRSSTNRLVFRGFELIPGIQIGLIEATDADRDTVAQTSTLRYGLTNRIELEARLPVLGRSDRIEVVQQRDQGIVRSIGLKEFGIGDAEFAVRYQINRPKGPQQPIFVGSVRVKTRTGKGPFDVGYDEFGVATGLATGSGFWAVQPGINFLLPSDPAVIFGSASYIYHIPRNVDKLVGNAFVGRVDPGDAISASLGFGFALNPRFSFSLGYGHTYIMPGSQEIGNTIQRSKSLQVGTFNFGMSYRLNQRQTVNASFEMGATSDAPDLSVTLRFPFWFAGGR